MELLQHRLYPLDRSISFYGLLTTCMSGSQFLELKLDRSNGHVFIQSYERDPIFGTQTQIESQCGSQ